MPTIFLFLFSRLQEHINPTILMDAKQWVRALILLRLFGSCVFGGTVHHATQQPHHHQQNNHHKNVRSLFLDLKGFFFKKPNTQPLTKKASFYYMFLGKFYCSLS